MYLTEDLDDVLTYWSPAGITDEGIPGLSAPVTLEGRWEETAELFRDQDGREVVSKAKAFLGVDVEIGGHLFNGESVSETPPAGAYEIRGYRKVKELGGDEYAREAWL